MSQHSDPDDGQYRLLFAVKLWALLATGIATVELSLIAHSVAGTDSSALLGTALSLKSLAYVVVPLLTAAIFAKLPRGRFLVALDLVRAGALASLTVASGEFAFLAAITVFLMASAAHSIAYLEYVSHLLPDREDFARAMSKSRIADELSGVVAPLAAAGLLLLLPIDGVLLLAAAVFAASALRIALAGLPDLSGAQPGDKARRVLGGLRMYAARAELRPLVWLMVAVAAGTAMVMTTTPYLVQSVSGQDSTSAAIAFGAFGAGAILGALIHLRLPPRLAGRPEMVLGSVVIAAALLAGIGATRFGTILTLWALIGVGVSLVQMPAAEIIRKAGETEGLLVAFGGSLAMQNAILVMAYAMAGGIATGFGPTAAFATMGGLAALAVILARAGGPHLARPAPAGRHR